jgi:hypothetical protein
MISLKIANMIPGVKNCCILSSRGGADGRDHAMRGFFVPLPGPAVMHGYQQKILSWLNTSATSSS